MSLPHHSIWAGFKNYISHREIRRSLPSSPPWVPTPEEEQRTSTHTMKQSWSHWAGQKIRRHPTDIATVDEVHLIPGWATKRPRRPTPGEPESELFSFTSVVALTVHPTDTFDVEVYVSGFATSRRIPEILTRSQRAFLKLARGFASVPKLQPVLRPSDTELQLEFPELLHLPSRPSENSDDYEVESLEAHFQNSGNHEADDFPFTSQQVDPIPAELARLHENMKSRLKLFWASSLPSRRVQLSIFLQTHDPGHKKSPVFTQEILTGQDGHFSGIFKMDWAKICARLISPQNTSEQSHAELELLVEARIINTESTPELHATPTAAINIPITHSSLRVISDIDDTVKVSKVTDGARAIFNQVFVKDLEDTVIPEMGEWYEAMWKCGVSFHYVSNGPFELFPVINQFISISKLPRGSIRLRSYAGRSLFNGILSAPGARKRGNVVEVLDQFPEARFLLVGDSGEQDLEVYSSLAAERPNQIVGVFIRDVWVVGLEDPTGMMIDVGLTNSSMKLKSRGTVPFPSNASARMTPKRAASDTDVSPAYPGAIRIPRPTKKGSLPPAPHSFEPSPELNFLSRLSEDSLSSAASSGSSASHSRSVRPITEGEKRRLDLQNRVNKARSIMPLHVVLRVFEDPKECVEAVQIAQLQEGVGLR